MHLYIFIRILQNVPIPKLGAEEYFQIAFTRREVDGQEYLICQHCQTQIGCEQLDDHLHYHLDEDVVINGKLFTCIRVLRNENGDYDESKHTVVCPVCDRLVERVRFKEHAVSHAPQHKCMIKGCYEVKPGKDGLRKHIQRKHRAFLPDDKDITSDHEAVFRVFPKGIKPEKPQKPRTFEQRKQAKEASFHKHQKEKVKTALAKQSSCKEPKSILKKPKVKHTRAHLDKLGITQKELQEKIKAAEKKADKDRKQRQEAGKQAAKERDERIYEEAQDKQKRTYEIMTNKRAHDNSPRKEHKRRKSQNKQQDNKK